MRALLLAIAVTGIAAGTAVPPAALAQAEAGRSMSVPISPTAPERYVVKKGDTLWDISGMYLNDPWYWPEIWYVNPSIRNPHLIYPGDVLYFSYVDGKPRVSLEPASAMRLSPEVRSSDLDGAIRAIPYDLLMDFVSRPSLLDRDQVRNSPYIVGMRDRHIVGSTANEVYSRGLDQPAAGTRYNIINVGEERADCAQLKLNSLVPTGVPQELVAKRDRNGRAADDRRGHAEFHGYPLPSGVLLGAQ